MLFHYMDPVSFTWSPLEDGFPSHQPRWFWGSMSMLIFRECTSSICHRLIPVANGPKADMKRPKAVLKKPYKVKLGLWRSMPRHVATIYLHSLDSARKRGAESVSQHLFCFNVVSNEVQSQSSLADCLAVLDTGDE